MEQDRSTIVVRLVWILAALALAMTAYYLGALVVAEQIFNGVNGIFWTIGQAMLNGYTLYDDIFETKPPLIFVISAVSLKLFGSPVLGYVLHTFLLFAVPIGTILYVRRRAGTGKQSLPLVLLSFLFATLIVRYLSRHPTAWAIEFLGLASCCLFLLVYADAKQVKAGRIALLTLLLAMTIGMKESFLLSALAGVLVLSRSPRQFIRGFIAPCILTGIIGVAALAAIGSFHGYFFIYLPEIFGYYTQRFAMPMLLKGLVFDKTFESLWLFSTGFLFACLALMVLPRFLALSLSGRRALWAWVMRFIAIITVSLYSATSFFFMTGQGALLLVVGLCAHRCFVRRVRSGADIALTVGALSMLLVRYACVLVRYAGERMTGQPVDSLVCVAPSIITGVLLVMTAAVSWAVFSALRAPANDERPLLLSQAAVLVALLIFYGLILLTIQVPFIWTGIVFPLAVLGVAWKTWSLRGTEEGDTLVFLGLRFVAFYISIYAVAMGSDFQGHHFLSLAPLLFAFLLPFVDQLALRDVRPVTMGSLAAIALVVVLNPLRHPSLDDLRPALEASAAQMNAYQEQADGIDRILDVCGLQRYLVLYAGDVHAFTRHTPQNFFLWAGLQGIAHHPTVSKKTFESVAFADIIFVGADIPPDDMLSEIDKGSIQYIESKFSKTPWPCAANIEPPPVLLTLYRTERAGQAMPQLVTE